MSNKVLIWDLPIRIFHCLLAFRLLWGFVGNRYARFSSFLCSPVTALSYLQDEFAFKAKRYLGHNPAGAWMIVLILLGLLFTVLTGLAVYAADQNAGPLAGVISRQYEDLWEDVHEIFANSMMFLVIVHILGVLLESFVHKENLPKSMWHGYKNVADDEHDG